MVKKMAESKTPQPPSEVKPELKTEPKQEAPLKHGVGEVLVYPGKIISRIPAENTSYSPRVSKEKRREKLVNQLAALNKNLREMDKSGGNRGAKAKDNSREIHSEIKRINKLLAKNRY